MPAPRQATRLISLRIPKFPRLLRSGWTEALAVNSKLLVAAPLAFTLIVGSGVIARTYRSSNSDLKAAASVVPQQKRETGAPSTGPLPAPLAATEPVASPPEPETPPRQQERRAAVPKARATAAPPTASAVLQTARVKDLEAPLRAKEVVTPQRAKEPEPVATAPASAREAVINIIALPWAEVYVDGTRQGVSPPLRSITIRPGKHRVELRNASFPTYVETVELKSGAEVSVRHRFRR